MDMTEVRWLCGVGAAVAVFSLALPPTGAQAQQVAPVTLRSGLVADPVRGLAYVMTAEGGVAAIDLGTGTTRWTSNDAAKPLALVGNLLVSQVESRAAGGPLELVVLDTEQRGALATRGNLELPAGVRVSIGETLEGTFTIDAQPSNGGVIATWNYVPAPRRGVDDTAGVIRLRPGEMPRGALRMDISTGQVTPLDTGDVPAVPISRWILPADERIPRAAAAQYQSADGRHVLASERIADDRTWQNYRWMVYDRGTGQPLGEIRNYLSFAPFVVHDSLVVYETTPYVRRGEEAEPAKLRGVSLRSGQEVWSVPVREIVYRGPVPP
jgi:hypothetical protein